MNRYPDDALDDLLGVRNTPPCDDALRESILKQTLRIVGRRQRRLRAVALALAASFLLGIAGYFAYPPSRIPPPAAPGPGTAPTPATPETLAADAPAAVIERIGETSAPDQRASLYRRAGDRYLEESADPSAALRCYVQALDEGSDDDLTVSVNDSWLLMALKMDRRKERGHANRD